MKDERSADRGRQPGDQVPDDLVLLDAEAYAAERVARERAEIASFERRWPLRRQLLETLVRGPRTPSELAQTTDSALASVSRQLRELRNQSFVRTTASTADRRRRLYAITREGEAELNRHRAFGAPDPLPPQPTTDDTYHFLCTSLCNAVHMRRQTNLLSQARERLELVLAEAERIGRPKLALEAAMELATTLRQNRQMQEVHRIVDRLNDIALGRDSRCGPDLALPAAAHHAYTLGRLPGEEDSEDLGMREEHLIAARQFYAQLAYAAPANDGGLTTWRHREAWSVVSRASNLRAQSRYESALESTEEAAAIFQDLGDAYGMARCLFMHGFCLRLIGDFTGSWRQLSAAHELATKEKFERFQTDALTQMGEVRRCQGATEEAGELLTEALQRAERMRMVVAAAFAQSAMGAVEYQAGRPEPARAALRLADRLFVECGSREGLALNARRQAVVARVLAAEEHAGELSAAQEYAAQALKRYEGMHSPAGVAACEVERARISVIRGRKPAGLSRLVRLLSRTRERELVERDPWVPTVLLAFAAEAGHDVLQDQAQRIADASRQLLGDWRKRDIGATPSTTRDRRRSRRHLPHASFEMGGETRRELQLA